MKPLIFILSFCCILCAACVDDDQEDITPSGDECGTHCSGVAQCNDGYCTCPDSTGSIAPGFCLQNSTGAVFVTYDQIPGMTDTTILHFDADPTENIWRDGDFLRKPVTGFVYNREGTAVTPQRADLGFIKYPGIPQIAVDSVFLYFVFDKSNRHSFYLQDGWNCAGKIFHGRFTDPDTIEGEVLINLCENRGTEPFPENLENLARGSFPVTYHRLN